MTSEQKAQATRAMTIAAMNGTANDQWERRDMDAQQGIGRIG
jgi:hypothetical protein